MPTTLPLYQVDAFTDQLFRGNPAAVVPLKDDWLPDDVMQAIALENNLSETAFFLPATDRDDADYHLRWFTPGMEVSLCGHATLATGHVLREHLGIAHDRFTFHTRSDLVSVRVQDDRKLALDFPAVSCTEVAIDGAVVDALSARPCALFVADPPRDRDMMAVFDTAETIQSLEPDLRALRDIGQGCIVVTAPGDAPEIDFVSRFFAPGVGVDEDPVTGSTHCLLTPHWARRTGKNQLRARQLSRRGGELFLTFHPKKNRVDIAGHAVTFMVGEIQVDVSQRLTAP